MSSQDLSEYVQNELWHFGYPYTVVRHPVKHTTSDSGLAAGPNSFW